ncbi:MAG: FAD:protein FMN transferase [Butyrivibrio sp.]|jgi:thiamine biosynthesis lipoprotein|nr:FAD:protein FMN transferase [Butyrivibrio sp.]
MNKKHFIFIPVILFLTAALFSGCTVKKSGPISRTGFYFDTVISIAIYDSENETILDGCMKMASHYDQLLSAQKEGSDIWNVNHAKGKPVTVDSDTADLLQKALYYARLSGGRFDPTLGGVSSLWNFNGQTPGPVPAASDISSALTHVGYQNIELSGNTVTLKDPDTQIDLGAIAKGYIADQIKSYLQKQGVKSAIINLGGNVLLVGSKPDHEEFTIGIQKPFADNSTYITTVSASDLSIVSSGTYERYFEQDGKKYHHILDPSTGYPVENHLLGVTILSKLSVDGDGLSTTCFVLGLDEGMKLIESLPDTEAVFITDDDQLHYSSGFPQ